ncbi:MAG: FAD-binding oxidoreductase, partial [Actinomycetota bacterium]|nr:FAD-binding oxidoreductase [Actinomycetota bacterium]
ESVVYIRTLGGAIARVRDDETAYPHRAAGFNVSVDASWHDPALDDAAIGWARSTWEALAPFATGGVYLNFAGLGEEDALRATALGAHETRLAEIRRTYDPSGLFEAAAHRA